MPSGSTPTQSTSSSLKIGTTISGRYRILAPPAIDRQVETYRGVDDKDHKQVTVLVTPRRIEQNRDSATVIDILNSGKLYVPGIPRILAVTHHKRFTIRVVTGQGPRLDQLLRYCRDRFSPKTVAMLAIQALRRLEAVHAHGFAHGSVCPEFFAMGQGPLDAHHLLLTGFGCANALADAAAAGVEGDRTSRSSNEKFGMMKSGDNETSPANTAQQPPSLIPLTLTTTPTTTSSNQKSLEQQFESDNSQSHSSKEHQQQQHQQQQLSGSQTSSGGGGSARRHDVTIPPRDDQQQHHQHQHHSSASAGKTYEQWNDCSDAISRVFTSVRLDEHYMSAKRALAAHARQLQQQVEELHHESTTMLSSDGVNSSSGSFALTQEQFLHIVTEDKKKKQPKNDDDSNSIPSSAAAAAAAALEHSTVNNTATPAKSGPLSSASSPPPSVVSPWSPATAHDDIESLVFCLWLFDCGSLPWDTEQQQQQHIVSSGGSKTRLGGGYSAVRRLSEIKVHRSSPITVASSVSVAAIAKMHDANRRSIEAGDPRPNYDLYRSFFEDFLREELQLDHEALNYHFDWTPSVVQHVESANKKR